MNPIRQLAGRLREIFWRDAGNQQSVAWMFIVNGILASHVFPTRIRTQLLRLFIPGIDRKALIKTGVTFRSRNVRIGPSTTIGHGVLIDTRQPLTIGSRVGIGSFVVLVDTDHDMSDPQCRAGATHSKPIVIGDGARVSTRTIVLPGVTIGRGAAVGAGSLVRTDCDPDTLYAGTPARRLRDLPA